MSDHEHVTKDAPLTQVIAFDDNSITLYKKEPFGHIHLALTKGVLPERFQGAYTSFSLANQSAIEYIEQYRKTKEEIKKRVNGTAKSNSSREQLS